MNLNHFEDFAIFTTGTDLRNTYPYCDGWRIIRSIDPAGQRHRLLMGKHGTGPYRGYTITHNPKPIPWRGDDWDFVHEDYDGPEDHRCGTAANLDACKDEIDMIEDEPE